MPSSKSLCEMYPRSANSLPYRSFARTFHTLGVAVVGVGRGEAEGDDFRLVVADEVQLEPVAPAHSPLAVGGKPIEHLVHVSPDVVADGYHGGVHVAHAVASAERAHLQEEHHDEEHAALQLHKTVVRDCRGEQVLAAAEDVVDVEMLEALVAPDVEHQLHSHYLAVGHGRLAAATLLSGGREEVFLKFGVEILAEFVHNAENLT